MTLDLLPRLKSREEVKLVEWTPITVDTGADSHTRMM